MDTSSFEVQFHHHDRLHEVRVNPCCNEDNIVDYAIWQNDKLLCTITKDAEDPAHWVVALKNSDDTFGEDMIQDIGKAIELHQTLK